MHPTIHLLPVGNADPRSTQALFPKSAWCVQVLETLEQLEAVESGSCLILDWEGPGYEILETIANARALSSELPVILLSTHADVALIVRAVRMGASDFLHKPVSVQHLMDSVHKALTNMQPPACSDEPGEKRLASLTHRESEVLDHIIDGATSKEIATRIGIAKKTVDTHRHNIMRKTRAKSVGSLVRMALQSQSLRTNMDHF